MKIALVCSNEKGLHEVSRRLEDNGHSVTLVQGGKEKIRTVVDQDRPDLLLIEEQFSNLSEFGEIEYVTESHPKTTVILLCASPTPEFLLSAMRAGVREVLPSPVPAAEIEAAVTRIAAKKTDSRPKQPGKILAFMSCKGGCGSTFLSTNLGYQLAETQSVLLIDMNLQFGDALSFVYDRAPASTLADVSRNIHRLDASFLAASTVKVSENYSILAAPEDPAQSIEVKPEHIDAILTLAAAKYDVVLLDMGRTLDTVSIKALDQAYRIFVVLQMGLPYLRNAKKLIETFNALGYPQEKTEIIVNRFEKRGEIGMDDMRRLLGSITTYTVPNSYKHVNVSINQGTPLIEMGRSNEIIRNLTEFSLALNTVQPEQKKEESRSFLGRMFKRA